MTDLEWLLSFIGGGIAVSIISKMAVSAFLRWLDSWPEMSRDTWTKIVNRGGKEDA